MSEKAVNDELGFRLCTNSMSSLLNLAWGLWGLIVLRGLRMATCPWLAKQPPGFLANMLGFRV